MKNIVAISLVFFSLTHLAKAEQRVDRLRFLVDSYCNRQLQNEFNLTICKDQSVDNSHANFLTYNELSIAGIVFHEKTPVFEIPNHIIAYLTISQNAKNNSP